MGKTNQDCCHGCFDIYNCQTKFTIVIFIIVLIIFSLPCPALKVQSLVAPLEHLDDYHHLLNDNDYHYHYYYHQTMIAQASNIIIVLWQTCF